MRRFGLIVFLSLIVCHFSLAFGDYIPGELIVKFRPGIVRMPKGMTAASVKAASVTASSIRALNAKHGVTRLEQAYKDALAIRPDWKHLEDDYLLVFPKDKDVLKVAQDFKKDPNVVFASPNSIVRAFETPDDPYLLQQWGLSKIEATKGWDKTTGTSETIIAVLDTGINYDHEDLLGKVDLTHAWDYVNDDNDPWDDYGHGTAVSGVLGAITNNAKGVAGMDWRAKILPIKVLDSSGVGSVLNINKALTYLAGLKSAGVNIQVINMSLGQYNEGTDKYTEQNIAGLRDHCLEAYNQGIVLVAAAGNDNVDWNTYPAYYSTVLAVAATDSTDKRSVWSSPLASNYGTWVDVSAPGSGIVSTDRGGSYSSGWNGTSLASPYAAGLAALIRAANPGISNSLVIEQIKGSADNIDSLNPGYVGKLGTGRINAFRALAGLLIEISSPANGEYIKGSKEIRGTAAGWNFNSYTLEALRSGSVEALLVNSAVSVESGVLYNWDTTGFDGPYTLRLRVFSSNGSSVESNVSVVVDNVTPEVAIALPAPGGTVEGRVNIIGKVKDNYLNYYVLEYGAGTSPATYQSIGTFYTSVESGVLGTWEASGLSGIYTLRLTAYDRAGTSSTVSVFLNLIGKPSSNKVVLPQAGMPLTYCLPNPFDRTVTSETSFRYVLSDNFNVTIYLFDLNGNLIWRNSYPTGQNGGRTGSNPPNNPPWNGQNFYGERVPNGVYIYQVTADQKVLARGKIIVLK